MPIGVGHMKLAVGSGSSHQSSIASCGTMSSCSGSLRTSAPSACSPPPSGPPATGSDPVQAAAAVSAMANAMRMSAPAADEPDQAEEEQGADAGGGATADRTAAVAVPGLDDGRDRRRVVHHVAGRTLLTHFLDVVAVRPVGVVPRVLAGAVRERQLPAVLGDQHRRSGEDVVVRDEAAVID